MGFVTEINNKADFLKGVGKLTQFMSPVQISALQGIVRDGEEKAFAYEVVASISKTISTMPKTYETDGQGDKAIAHLHYFSGDSDFYITERDMEDDQHQAFGLVSNQHGFEVGYINIVELKNNGVELDFHFEPAPLSDIKAKLESQALMG